MRKFFFVILCLILCGCSFKDDSYEESYKVYQSYIEAIINNKGIISKSVPFDYKMKVTKQKDSTYKYEIEISNPQIAMYDIQAIALDPSIDLNTNIAPCIGILGEDAVKKYNMVPFQSRPELGYISKMSLESISKEEQFSINVMVIWKDQTLQNQNRVFFNCNYVQKKGDVENGQKETSDEGTNNVG